MQSYLNYFEFMHRKINQTPSIMWLKSTTIIQMAQDSFQLHMNISQATNVGY